MKRHLPLVALALLLGVSLWAGLRGLDFGRHWDERHLVGQAHKALRSELLLPRSYHYPSVPFWLATAGLALGEVPEKLQSPSLRPDGQRTATAPAPPAPGDPVLRIRAIFLIFSVLVVAWTYAAARGLDLRPGPALVAAGLVATSFELGYHQRWIAPDALVAMWAAATLACAVRTRGDPRWLWPTAVAAGLCCGTKYTGGILLVAVWLAAWPAPDRRARVRRLVLATVVFGATFVVSTPGALLDHGLFWRHVEYELRHYAQGHGHYTVAGPLAHLGLVGRWLGDSALSPWPVVAGGLAGLALFGGVVAGRRARGHRLLVLGVPALYLGYMALQKVFFTRNLLIVLPFFALAAAFGAQALLDRCRPAALRAAVGGAFAVLLVAQAVAQIHAGESIRARRTGAATEAFSAWCRAHPEAAVQPTARVRAAVGEQPCFGAGGDRVFFLSEGHPDSRRYPTLGTRWYREVFGPRDITLRWYGSWLGDDRLVVAPAGAERP